ncbi:GNAT family N-acetyltransferase [Pandoraea pnomenusa]|uniref:GNAT family N-acetyltransferase n=1 Tax=Pandoraea pnomenusa TaxID=93220 RepID=UPI00333FAB06
MILTGFEVAHALEFVEASHLARQVAMFRSLTQRDDAYALNVCGGMAALTDRVFGRKLNHVTGLGMGATVDAEAIRQLEDAYHVRALDVEIDVCPHADPSTLAVLSARGYTVNAFSNTYVRGLEGDDVDLPPPDGVEIVTDRSIVDGLFVPNSVAAFETQATPRPRVLLETLAKIALARTDTTRFIALLDGRVAGTAGVSVIDSPMGKVAHLYIASTHPAYRGRGVQLALIRARLAAARAAGCVMASVTARAQNVSARNTERAGFALAYTKATFAKPYARPVDGR